MTEREARELIRKHGARRFYVRMDVGGDIQLEMAQEYPEDRIREMTLEIELLKSQVRSLMSIAFKIPYGEVEGVIAGGSQDTGVSGRKGQTARDALRDVHAQENAGV